MRSISTRVRVLLVLLVVVVIAVLVVSRGLSAKGRLVGTWDVGDSSSSAYVFSGEGTWVYSADNGSQDSGTYEITSANGGTTVVLTRAGNAGTVNAVLGRDGTLALGGGRLTREQDRHWEAFWSGWWWPLATALLGFAFTWLVFAQWLQRRKPHQLAWAVGMLMYSAAAVMEAVSEFMGHWDPIVYRFYIVLAASLVGFLGLGSYYLVAKKRLGPHIYLGLILVGLGVFFYGVFKVDLQMDKLVPGITVGGQALGDARAFPRVMSLPFNISGSFFLLGGALLSVWRFARKKEYAYRMWANVLIAIGTVLIAAAGGLARAGTTAGLYPAEMAASAILLAGFLLAGTLDKGAKEAIAHSREQREREASEHVAREQQAPELATPAQEAPEPATPVPATPVLAMREQEVPQPELPTDESQPAESPTDEAPQPEVPANEAAQTGRPTHHVDLSSPDQPSS